MKKVSISLVLFLISCLPCKTSNTSFIHPDEYESFNVKPSTTQPTSQPTSQPTTQPTTQPATTESNRTLIEELQIRLILLEIEILNLELRILTLEKKLDKTPNITPPEWVPHRI